MKPLFVLLSFLSVSFLTEHLFAIDALEVTKQAKELGRGWKTYKVGLDMQIMSEGAKPIGRQIKFQHLEATDGHKSLALFDSPPDVRGTALLSHSYHDKADEQWLYLPALRRTKRITSGNMTGAFMGSEFTFEDILTPKLSDFKYLSLKNEKCGSADCFVVERSPTSSDSGYSKQVVWYDKPALRVLRIDYYDRKGAMLKRLTYAGYNKYLNKFWFAGEMKMVNMQNKKSTLITFSGYEFGKAISESNFRPENLQSVK